MTAKPPPSPGRTKSSSSPANSAACTTSAAAPDADDWRRTGPDTIEHPAGYRIQKSHVGRLLDQAAPMYHAYGPGGAFLGVAGGEAERAKALCAEHFKAGIPA